MFVKRFYSGYKWLNAGIKSHDLKEGRYYLAAKRNHNNTVSVYTLRKTFVKDYREAAVVSHGCLLRSKLAYANPYIQHEDVLKDYICIGNAEDIVLNIYGEADYIGFNLKSKSKKESLSSILCMDGEEYEDMVSLPEINHNVVIRKLHENNNFPAAYIQRVSDDTSVVRIFVLGKNNNIKEISRIISKEDESVFLYNRQGKFIIDENPVFSSMKFDISGHDDLNGLKTGYIYNCFKKSSNAGFLLSISLIMPAFENLIKINMPNLMESLTNNQAGWKNAVFDIFNSELKNKHSFSDAIGMPVWMFKYFDEHKEKIWIIKYVKYFYPVKEKINCINCEKLEKIICLIEKYIKIYGDSGKRTIKSIIEVFGERNINSYLEFFINNHFKEEEISSYNDYIYKVHFYALKEMGCHWKIKPCDIGKTLQLIKNIVNYRKDNAILKKYDEMFANHKNALNVYAYKNSQFVIKVPCNINDIVNEAAMLKHCGLDFIPAIASGKTALLFIRKTGNLDAPFYTLEVADGKIRQCFGKHNCQISPDIRNFLYKWCKEKQIIYDETPISMHPHI